MYCRSQPGPCRLPPHTQLLKGKAFILKSLTYDSVHRADLFKLPYAPSALEAYLARPDITISTQQPWILQEFLKVRTCMSAEPAHNSSSPVHNAQPAACPAVPSA